MLKKAVLKNKLSFLVALVFSFTIWFYVPLTSFLVNQGQYSFKLKALIFDMIIPFLIFTVVLFVILYAVNRFIFLKKNKEVKKIQDTASPAHIFFIFAIFGIWLEGFILSKNLPALTGEKDLFSDVFRLVTDSLVWVVLLVLLVVFREKLKKYVVPMLVGVCLLLGFGFADAFMSQQTPIPVKASFSEVVDNVKFSKDDNVMIFVLDSMSTALVKEYIENNPEAKDDLEGFVMFENNMETAKTTQWSIPSILRGDTYDGTEESLDYQSGSYSVKKALPVTFLNKGYDVYSSSFLQIFNYISGEDVVATSDNERVDISAEIYGQFFVKYSPYVFKNMIANRVGFSPVVVQSSSDDGNIAKSKIDTKLDYDPFVTGVLNYATKNSIDSESPTFQFHHINGPHMPFTIDKNGNKLPASEEHSILGMQEQMEWSMKQMRSIINDMKESGIYDLSTIVLLGDHGDRMSSDERKYNKYAGHASLLIKPKGSKDTFTVSADPTSNVYLAEIIKAIHLDNKSLSDVVAEYRGRNREVYYPAQSKVYEYSGDDVTSLKTVRSFERKQQVEVTTLVPDINYSLSLVVESEEKAVPLEADGANIDNGLGIRAEQDTFQSKFVVDESMKGKKYNVTLRFEHMIPGGGFTKYEPYILTVKDMVSGSSAEFAMKDDYEEVTLEGVEIDDNSNLCLEFNANPYDKKKLQVLIDHILIKEAK